MEAAESVTTLTDVIAENWKWTLIASVAVLWIIFATVESIVKSVVRERSRREIAAYIAEGSMSAEEGERLLKPGSK